jgi:aminoglycoside phosphotransferase family enzyme
VAITPARYRQGLADDVSANGHELSLPAYALSKTDIASIIRCQLALLEQDPALFDARVHTGKIIEAHGDLRPEHICLERQPAIIDCLEFNRELRILDIASELAFLALECERLGAPQVGNLILEAYGDTTGDWLPPRLLQFYKSYHACIRAKIAVWHLKEPDARDRTTWISKANHYLQLASYIMPPGRDA